MGLSTAFQALLMRVTDGFAIFCESWNPLNSQGLWQDKSGNGRHLQGYFDFGTDAVSGLPAYSAPTGNGGDSMTWLMPNVSNTPSSYTAYFLFRVDEESDVYIFLMSDDAFSFGYTYFGLNSNEAKAISQGTPHEISPRVVAGETALLTMQMNADTGIYSIRKNGAPYLSGIPYTATKSTGGYIYNQSNYHQLRGQQFGFALSVGNDSLAKITTLETAWMLKLGIVGQPNYGLQFGNSNGGALGITTAAAPALGTDWKISVRFKNEESASAYVWRAHRDFNNTTYNMFRYASGQMMFFIDLTPTGQNAALYFPIPVTDTASEPFRTYEIEYKNGVLSGWQDGQPSNTQSLPGLELYPIDYYVFSSRGGYLWAGVFDFFQVMSSGVALHEYTFNTPASWNTLPNYGTLGGVLSYVYQNSGQPAKLAFLKIP